MDIRRTCVTKIAEYILIIRALIGGFIGLFDEHKNPHLEDTHMNSEMYEANGYMYDLDLLIWIPPFQNDCPYS